MPCSVCQPSWNEWALQSTVNGAADPENLSLKTEGKIQNFNFVAITNFFTSEMSLAVLGGIQSSLILYSSSLLIMEPF